ncbi:MAG: hypothetical protein FJ038_12450 [Chloroflexi bacterium]|nr:hypothetical protein [Chloroflexota bacterium]
MDIDRGCRSKLAFFLKAEAKRVAQGMSRRTGEPFHLYRCPACRHDHVGHVVPEPIRLAA